ncbi:MAG: flagellin [Rhodobacterales bacterium]
MTSILTNNSAMNALSTLRNINNNLSTTQDRISSGLKVSSAKDNAAYFAISSTMKGDSASIKSINEGLTLTKNSIATARLGAENFKDLATQFTERLAFAQGAKGGFAEIGKELDELVKQMSTTISQSTFNGDNLVNAGGTFDEADLGDLVWDATEQTYSDDQFATKTVSNKEIVTGVTRAGDGFEVTKISITTVDLAAMLEDFKVISANFATNAVLDTAVTVDVDGDDVQVSTQGERFLQAALKHSTAVLADATNAATSLGLSEKAITTQQSFLSALTDNINSGIGSMVDANMEDEATRLQALQVQQQLATQALSIANQGPQNILSLFR